jgi:HSP20 family protein
MSDEMVKQEAGTAAVTAERTRGGTTYLPPFDIVETDTELTLFGDLPGVTLDNLDIRFESEHLIIQGKVQPRHSDLEYLYGEYGIGDYYREFHISESIDSGKITAELKDGVLTLHLPKVEAVKPKRIEVKAG